MIFINIAPSCITPVWTIAPSTSLPQLQTFCSQLEQFFFSPLERTTTVSAILLAKQTSQKRHKMASQRKLVLEGQKICQEMVDATENSNTIKAKKSTQKTSASRQYHQGKANKLDDINICKETEAPHRRKIDKIVTIDAIIPLSITDVSTSPQKKEQQSNETITPPANPAFLLFSRECNGNNKHQNAHMQPIEFSKSIAERWRSLSSTERAVFEQRATEGHISHLSTGGDDIQSMMMQNDDSEITSETNGSFSENEEHRRYALLENFRKIRKQRQQKELMVEILPVQNESVSSSVTDENFSTENCQPKNINVHLPRFKRLATSYKNANSNEESSHHEVQLENNHATHALRKRSRILEVED